MRFYLIFINVENIRCIFVLTYALYMLYADHRENREAPQYSLRLSHTIHADPY